MSKLTALVCKGCGGQISNDTLVCRSCGTQYRWDENNQLITVTEYQRKLIYINGSVSVPAYIVEKDPQLAMEMTLTEIAREMAKKIMPLIEFATRFEPETMSYITSARIGVADPFDYSRYVEVNHSSPETFWGAEAKLFRHI